MTDLLFLSATEAARLFRSRALSPVELMQAVIDRAEAVEPKINAFTYRYFDEAMAAAKRSEARFVKGGRLRPLEGLPVAIKDAGHIRGKPTSGGSLTADDAPQAKTSPINDRVLRAGAICHARSATPEFSCASVTHSRRWGVTRNPWNTEFTPGGSSGGAGASLAAGSTTLATGSDIGGSIRIPASACGVVGFKPTLGRNPVDPPFNLDPYCHTGPMARSVADAILLQNVICGPHPMDTTALRPKLRIPAEPVSLKGWRIAWSMDLGFFEVDPEIAETTRGAVEMFEGLGAQVEHVELPWSWDVIKAGLTHLRHGFGSSLAKELAEAPELMTDYARSFAQEGVTVSAKASFKSQTKAAEMGAEFAKAMHGFDLFLCPTTALPAVSADFDPASERLQINGRDVEPMLGWVMTLPFNMLSRHPVLSVPSGRSHDGVPTGLQIVGRTFRDADVCRAGLAYEAACGGWYGAGQRPTI